ncbi:hypothetical protein FF011L_42520 [Roseimaritima multifibrata]|uniref:MgtE intracellular N domain protein n=1 Tax=Roseimaritima multifibrata TaxID=1930274 RepID=A0A517MKP3_9BACT|nr:hypothetical protein [Roseimaritima multifibrata]QDS95456.1 hypothetical protein FF011L_42520 [Roseimaritima multifibrata]
MGLVIRLFAGICIATIVTQGIVLGVCAGRGTLNAGSITQIVALLNGIDITGDRLRMIVEQSESTERPTYDQILMARTREGLDMDLRLDSQKRYSKELEDKFAELKRDQKLFDERREEFFAKLDEVRKGVMDDGMQELTETLQALDTEQAKIQLVRMIEDNRIEDVVSIIQATPIDKRSDILAEFVSQPEEEMLADILRMIGDGEPAKSLIDRSGK